MNTIRGQGVSVLFSALAHPDRVAILDALKSELRVTNQGLTISQLSTIVECSRFSVARHMRLLSEAKMVRCHQVGRCRRYTIVPHGLEAIEDWIYNLVDVKEQSASLDNTKSSV